MKNTTKMTILIMLAAFAISGCTSRKYVRGYRLEEKTINTIRPQVDTHDSVLTMLGSPSSRATFDDDSWYYYSKKSESLAFFKEEITDITIVAVRFDTDGYVTAVDHYGLADLKDIDPTDKTTPTHGRELSFIQELFGNIGRFGAGGPSSVRPGN